MRRSFLILIAGLALVIGIAVAASAIPGESSVTRARLERSLPTVFANLYVKQAELLGRPGLSTADLHASAMCDKHGASGPDVGPGGDWVCLMSWDDPEVPMPAEGYGKFELNVHSNDCYTASGPSKLVGFLTLTDTTGVTVDNPVFEFDGCFDPHSSNEPTSVTFPSLLAITSTAASPDSDGRVGVQVTCGTGDGGCVGTLSAREGSKDLGSVPLKLAEETSTTITVPGVVPAGSPGVDFAVSLSSGVGPSKPVTVPLTG